MRPNHSVPPSTTSRKSPLGGLLIPGLYFGLFLSVVAAQTRLDSSQVSTLQGAVQGPFKGNVLRDLNSAASHGNETTNGIAYAIADCGVTRSCSVIVPPSYGSTEKVPGYQLDFTNPPLAATTPGNVAIFDRRYSDARMFVDNLGYTVSLINAPSGWLYNYYAKAAQNANIASFFNRQWSLSGGTNQKAAALNYVDKTSWDTILANGISHSPGQHVNFVTSNQNTSQGNNVAINNLVNCSGGYTTEGDLGCHAMDNIVAQGTVEYSGTLTGSPSAGETSLSVSPTQGAYTQGAGRFLVDASSGTISSGAITQLNSSNTATSVVGSGTAWPASTIIGQLGANINSPGAAVVTPTLSTGSMSGLNTSSLICVADPGSFEMLTRTAVTANTFTATFAKVHPSGATISAGGLCGYLLDLAADDVTNATFPNKTQTITGTLHFAFPIIASASATSASVWVSGDGVSQQLLSRWNSAGANGYVLYPFAEVISAQQSGGLSNNLTLSPNNVRWAAGDTVSEFLYPAGHHLFGNTIIESFYPNIAGANGFSLQYNLPLQGNEAMMSLINNGPKSFYASNGGTYRGPFGIHLTGSTMHSLSVDLPPDNAVVGVACTAPCTGNEPIVAAANSVYYDFLFYDAANEHWNISTNVNATKYGLAANQFSVPFSGVSLSVDGNGVGYLATTQLRSSVGANSDTSGELLFSNAAAMTQNLQGAYTAHPECWARPQFDAGSANRHWITYGASSITINFATPVTGAVTYSCSARN